MGSIVSKQKLLNGKTTSFERLSYEKDINNNEALRQITRPTGTCTIEEGTNEKYSTKPQQNPERNKEQDDQSSTTLDDDIDPHQEQQLQQPFVIHSKQIREHVHQNDERIRKRRPIIDISSDEESITNELFKNNTCTQSNNSNNDDKDDTLSVDMENTTCFLKKTSFTTTSSFGKYSSSTASRYSSPDSSSMDDPSMEGAGMVYNWLESTTSTSTSTSTNSCGKVNSKTTSLVLGHGSKRRALDQISLANKPSIHIVPPVHVLSTTCRNEETDIMSPLAPSSSDIVLPPYTILKTPKNTSRANNMVTSPLGKHLDSSTSKPITSKAIFTPPGFESPLGLEVHTSDTTTFTETLECDNPVVKDTIRVKRKKAQLPNKKPQVVKGNWLTNRLIVNNYIILNVLGKGSYGEVRLCKEKNTNQIFAVKVIHKGILKKRKTQPIIGKNVLSSCMDDVKMEIDIMKKLNHENVLKLFEVMDDPKVNKIYLILEYMKQGDLMQIMGKEPLSDEEVWDIMRQVVRGLKYLHDNSIVHGDLKPQNILVAGDGLVKLSDFGISKMIDDGEMQHGHGGTPSFMAPEVCGKEIFDGKIADMWSVGATMFYIRFARAPFVLDKGNDGLAELYSKIQHDPISFPSSIDKGLETLITGLMIKFPQQRLTMIQVMTHPWLQSRP